MSLLKEFREYQKALQEQALLAETDAYFEAYDQMYDQLEEAVVLNENTLVNPAFLRVRSLPNLELLPSRLLVASFPKLTLPTSLVVFTTSLRISSNRLKTSSRRSFRKPPTNFQTPKSLPN
ncbi:hypothetical protein PHIM7_278 [Sinorhizobium phage phiM7]|uniref:Uncharacterized protein n=1 Tax=Sinorhizobium phage phiM7 TaxID=1647403 RepID=A0A0F6SIP7_9CAUD|nr:hypothetical protein FDH46_gp200 [Sinorhizobium phage phiM7]AKF12823.1 hypothetical protein PHIM7_278 [Sinorhizobium phage phiM7]